MSAPRVFSMTASVLAAIETPARPPVVPLQLSHFQALLLFALIISLAFGTLGRRRPIDRLKYAGWSFAMFVLVGLALGWLMYPFSR